MRHNHERGFTMLEVLVVVALTLILAAIVTPNLIESIRQYRIESVARETRDILLRARYLAAKKNQPISVIYQPPGGGNPALIGIDVQGLRGTAPTDGNGVLDQGEPRVTLPLDMDSFIGGAPWRVAAPDYTNVAAVLPGGVTFSQGGYVVTPGAGGVFLTDTQIRGFILQRTDGAANLTHEYMLTLTPAGRIRLWTRQPGTAGGPAGPWQPR